MKDPYLRSWRDYQERLRRGSRMARLARRILVPALAAGCLFLVWTFAFRASARLSRYFYPAPEYAAVQASPPGGASREWEGSDVRDLLKNLPAKGVRLQDRFTLNRDGTPVVVSSFLVPGFQAYILNLLRRSRTEAAAVVVLSPASGKILAMGNYEKDGRRDNLCTRAKFPAASLFKIVSAAAAMETAGYTPESQVSFVGRRHTLYKRQLTKKRRRWATKTTFTTAFASSINPVFGKLGIYDLGRDGLSAYAGKFFFNRPIPFDLPLEKSVVHLPNGDYGLAEVASGFNRKTLISPLHAALLAAVAANKGIMMRPRLVESISDTGGGFLYQSRPRPLGRCITAATARRLKTLMRETVRRGTCRKAFRSLRRRKPFRNIELGAKTGTINDASDRFKYEWFAGYALPRDASAGICVAVLGVHGEKLGIPSSELGREIIRHFMGRLREYARKAVPSSNKGTPRS